MKDTALPGQFLRDQIVLRECLIHIKNPESDGIRLPSDSSSGLLRIPLTCLSHDLSRFNQISFTAVNISNRPIYVEMKLFHGTGKTEVIDTPVSLSGGREVLRPGQQTELKFPFEAFGTYGHPDGWNNVNYPYPKGIGVLRHSYKSFRMLADCCMIRARPARFRKDGWDEHLSDTCIFL
jgi:hypothetical protein